MLTIRLQRTGRRGHAQYRLVVQDSRFSPTSGRVVSYVGSYNPHTKASQVDLESIKKYLANGAQPSPRVISLLKENKVAIPKWAAKPGDKKRAVRNPEKRRSTAPASEEPADETPAANQPEAAEAATETPAAEAQADNPAEAPSADEITAEASSSEEESPESSDPAS